MLLASDAYETVASSGIDPRTYTYPYGQTYLLAI